MRLTNYILFALIVVVNLNSTGQVSCENEATFTGDGTYYSIEEFGDFGNCSIENEAFDPFYIGALNAAQYGDADYCGACAEVTGPNGTLQIHIIDQCPECKSGDIDLSPEAFDLIADRIDGRVSISWKVVPCDVNGSVQFYFKEGSNEWWNAVQVRNHKNQLSKLEYWNGNQYINLPRQDYNYFLNESGLGKGPFQFRVTDVYGNQIVEKDIPFTLTTELDGENQFPDCNPLSIDEKSLSAVDYLQSDNSLIFLNLNSEYELVDLNGKTIKKGTTDINQISLNEGIYILRLFDGNSVVIDKIFIP